MRESIFSEGQIDATSTLKKVRTSSPDGIVSVARSISDLIKASDPSTELLFAHSFEQLQQTRSLDEQALILAFTFLLEGRAQLHEKTDDFLSELAACHNYKGQFTQSFRRFISERLRIAGTPQARRKTEDGEGTRKMLELLNVNEDFFHDIVDLQDYFSSHVSPVMPLNATWNPLLTDLFKVRGVEGLWYVYANNKRAEYVEAMKQQVSSEWTGFNRFATEPWDQIRQVVKKAGHMVDIGSSIGVSAIEIARELGMQGPIILVDYYNPLRRNSALRIIDYASPDGRFISLTEATAQMDDLRGDRVLVTLFGFDFGMVLPSDVKRIVANAAIVHCANVLPYLPVANLYQAIRNSIEITNSEGGILKFHNDDVLPIDNILRSIILQKNEDTLSILPGSTRGRPNHEVV